MSLHPLAGKPAPASALVDVPRLVAAYYTAAPDMAMSGQRVAFGTSGHRGSSLTASFNEAHILAVTPAPAEGRVDAHHCGASLHADARGGANHERADGHGTRWTVHRGRQGYNPQRLLRRATVGDRAGLRALCESLAGPDYLQQIQSEAQAIIAGALAESHAVRVACNPSSLST